MRRGIGGFGIDSLCPANAQFDSVVGGDVRVSVGEKTGFLMGQER